MTLIGREKTTSLPLPTYPFKAVRIKCFFKRGPQFYAEYNWRLYRLFRRLKPDIIGAIDYDTLKAATRAGKKLGRKVIFDAHEWFEEVPELEGRPKVKKYWQKIAKQSLPLTHLRYTVSQGVAGAMEARYNQKFHVIHNFPQLRQTEPSSIRDNVIVYLGVLNKGRGLPEMIKVMHDIDAQLWIIGDGDISTDLWKLANSEQLLHKVLFKGFVPPEEWPVLLEKARIGINLLDPASESYRLSLANKFFDYLHAGTPQVCMDFPEYRRFNDRYRVAALVQDLKPYTLSYTINHLLDDRNYWFTFHTSCLKARQQWNWQREAPRLKQLLENI